MKTTLISLVGAIVLIGSVGCKQEWTPYEEWQVASKQLIIITDYQESTQQIDTLFWVRNAPSEQWRYFDIHAFPNYEKGCEYILRVEIYNLQKPPYTGPHQTVFCNQILSKIKKESENIPRDTLFTTSHMD